MEQTVKPFDTGAFLNLLADLSHGKNLQQHLLTLQGNIDEMDVIIEHDGYLHPDIGSHLYTKGYFEHLAGHFATAIAQPDHRPDWQEVTQEYTLKRGLL